MSRKVIIDIPEESINIGSGNLIGMSINQMPAYGPNFRNVTITFAVNIKEFDVKKVWELAQNIQPGDEGVTYPRPQIFNLVLIPKGEKGES